MERGRKMSKSEIILLIISIITSLALAVCIAYLVLSKTKKTKKYKECEKIYVNEPMNKNNRIYGNNQLCGEEPLYEERQVYETESIYSNENIFINKKLPYKKKYILTKNEYGFYKELRKLTDPKGYQVITKIRLADIIEVNKNEIKYSEYIKYFNQIQSKHIDFLICDNNLHLLMAIELDDNSHYHERTIKSDYLKDNALASAGIKLIRCKGIGVIKEIFENSQNSYTYQQPYGNYYNKQ